MKNFINLLLVATLLSSCSGMYGMGKDCDSDPANCPKKHAAKAADLKRAATLDRDVSYVARTAAQDAANTAATASLKRPQ